MAGNDHEDRERDEHADWSRKHSPTAYRAWMEHLYSQWERDNTAYFHGALKRPHLAFGVTPPRSLWRFKPRTGNGAPVHFLFNERLMFPADLDQTREWVSETWSEGHRRFVEDALLSLTVRQQVHEVEGIDEETYRGFGPRFLYHANRIGPEIGVGQASLRSDGTGHFLASAWPHGGRPEGYYNGITSRALGLAVPTRTGTRRNGPAPPNLGMWDLVLFHLAMGTHKKLEDLARNQANWLDRLRTGKIPAAKKLFEEGKEEPDGQPIVGEASFNPGWLTANNGIARKLLEAITQYRTYADLPVLADALEEAGCEDGTILRHLRARMEHNVTCWVLRGLLGSQEQDVHNSGW
jgi:hypothetical protein